MTKTQTVLLEKMRGGLRLYWYGFAGPELEDHRFWPQKRTVRSMLRAGVLRWKPWANATQRSAGIRELEAVSPADHAGSADLDAPQVDKEAGCPLCRS